MNCSCDRTACMCYIPCKCKRECCIYKECFIKSGQLCCLCCKLLEDFSHDSHRVNKDSIKNVCECFIMESLVKIPQLITSDDQNVEVRNAEEKINIEAIPETEENIVDSTPELENISDGQQQNAQGAEGINVPHMHQRYDNYPFQTVRETFSRHLIELRRNKEGVENILRNLSEMENSDSQNNSQLKLRGSDYVWLNNEILRN
ncbi:hypothetical protein CDAR_622761 [Caerostris darwini]|uniref:CRC domain-containing protein n=1 Tax=Caerostris darwini TaxID=1538125 RepID=A0AAV4TD01_9ARAC|nr:hypothetical protein CDAR_622761 [Caerostris darwini]